MAFDAGLIIGNPVYLATLGLAMCGWIIFMAGLAAAKVEGVYWFFVVYMLFLILAVTAAIGTNSIRQYRFALLAYMTAAFVFLVGTVDGALRTNALLGIIRISPALQAASAGGLFLLMVLCVWMIIFGSEDDSAVITTIKSFGIEKSLYQNNTGLPPQHLQQQQQQPQQPQQLQQQQNVPRGPGVMSSQPNTQENLSTVVVSPNADYPYRAQALYEYQANPDDQNELSFAKGEILDIADNKGKWWQARKADGSIGIAPSNYLQLI